MTYKLCKIMILSGKTQGLLDKLDVFYVAGRLSAEQYNELVEMINPRAQE